jgi:sporulation protein YunB
MPFRRRLFRRRPRTFRVRRRMNVWLIASLIVFAISLQILWLVEHYLHPMLIVIAKTEVKKAAQDAMLQGVRDVQKKLGGDLDRIMTVDKSADGRIASVQIDPALQAQVYDHMTTQVLGKLNHLKEHEIGITLGQMLQSNLLAEYGPDIPIQMWLKGAPKVNFVPKMEAQGINMVMVTLTAHVHTEMGLIVPFSEESFPVDFEYPLAVRLVVGEVPEYYFYNDQGEMKKARVLPPAPDANVKGKH